MVSSMKRKSAARLAAIQVLYGRDVGDDTTAPSHQIAHILDAYSTQELSDENIYLDESMVLKLVTGTNGMLAEIDARIAQHLSSNWDMERLGAVMRALLRAGVYELIAFTDVPIKVVISEYVTLARSFFSESETGFVNGILDKIAREVRILHANEKNT